MPESQMVLDQKIRNRQDKIFSVLDNTAISLLFGQQFEQPLCMFHVLAKCLSAKWVSTKRNGTSMTHFFLFSDNTAITPLFSQLLTVYQSLFIQRGLGKFLSDK